MIRLHHVPFSRSFRVLWLLQEMGLEFDVAEYRIRDGSLRSAAFTKVSPTGRVPGIEIDGISMFESGAIVQYLCETRPEHGLAPTPGAPERPRFLELIGFAETMASLVEQLNLNHVFLRDPAQASAVVIKLNTARLTATVRVMEQMLGDQDYLLPSGFSAADTMMGFNVFSLPYYVHLEPFPRLLAYKQRLEARPAYQTARARDGEQDFYDKPFYPVPEA